MQWKQLAVELVVTLGQLVFSNRMQILDKPASGWSFRSEVRPAVSSSLINVGLVSDRSVVLIQSLLTL